MDVTTGNTVNWQSRFSNRLLRRAFWYLVKEKDAHKEEMEELRKSVEANTTAINSLCQHLGGGKNE